MAHAVITVSFMREYVTGISRRRKSSKGRWCIESACGEASTP